MKKLFLIAMTATGLLMTGCSENELIEQSNNPAEGATINLQPTTGKVLGRAVASNLATLQNDTDGFKVFATQKSGESAILRFNDFYKYDKVNSVWGWKSKTSDKKWPTDGDSYPMHFYACYPADLLSTTTYTSITPVIEPLAKDQKDMMVATAEKLGVPSSDDKMPLTFKHILSKIDFKVTVSKGYTAKIQSIKIVNVANTGSIYNLFVTAPTVPGYNANPEASTQDKSFAYRSYDDTSSSVGYNSAQVVEAKDAAQTSIAITGNSGSLMLLPQSAATWDKDGFRDKAEAYTGTSMSDWNTYMTGFFAGSYVEMVYVMTLTDTEGKVKNVAGISAGALKDPAGVVDGDKYTADRFVRVGYPLNLKEDGTPWVASAAYTYTIHLGDGASNGTILDPTLKDNKGEDGTTPEDEIDPGTDVTDIDKYIDFDVTVGEWAANDDLTNSDIK